MTSFLPDTLLTSDEEFLLNSFTPSSPLSPLLESDNEDRRVKNYNFDFGFTTSTSGPMGSTSFIDQLMENSDWKEEYLPPTNYSSNLNQITLPPHLSQLHNLVLNNPQWAPRMKPQDSNKMKRNHLSSWMCTQRVEKKKGELLEYRKRLLDLIGFVWSKQDKQQKRRNDEGRKEWTQEKEDQILNIVAHANTFTGRAQKNHEQWMLRFHEVVEFKRKNGHLKVPILIPSE